METLKLYPHSNKELYEDTGEDLQYVKQLL